MTFQRYFSAIRWPLAGVLSVGAGVALGRLVRSDSRDGADFLEARRGGNRGEAAGHGAERSAPAREGMPPGADASVVGQDAHANLAQLLGISAGVGGKFSPEQLMDAISTLKDEKSQFRRFMGVYEAVSLLGKEDMEQALRRARDEKDEVAMTALHRRWAEVDPVSAANSWLQGTDKLVNSSIFSTWAKINPAGALRWLSQLEASPRRDEARTAIFYSVARSDPQRALEMAAQFPEGADRALLVSRAIHYMAGEDAGQALAAAKAQTDPAVRNAGLDVVVSKLAATQLEEAQRVFAELPPNSLVQGAGLIAAGLVRQSPQKAVEWAQSLPEGPSRDAVYGSIAKEWAARDVEGLAAWLDKLPQGSARNSAVLAFAGRSALSDPEGAALWLSTIPWGDARTKLLTTAFSNWQRVNPKAAQQWIQTSQHLSPEERAALGAALQTTGKPVVPTKKP